MNKLVLIIITAATLAAIPGIVFAQADIQQASSRCFAQSDCIAARQKLNEDLGYGLPDQEIQAGFYTGDDAQSVCGARMYSKAGVEERAGFCLPVGQADTKVAIGGRTRFGNVAEFIVFVYKYSFIVGAVLAVLMIIVAGFQYVVSAGDTTKITSAKKRISGAIMGLVLLATSYTILNTINPALVQLRLPNIWLIRGDALAPAFCRDVSPPAPLALAREQGAEAQTPFSPALFTGGDTVEPADAPCGDEFYIANAGGQICRGTFCPPPAEGGIATCIPGEWRCVAGNVVGIVSADSGLLDAAFSEGGVVGAVARVVVGLLETVFGEGWSWPWLSLTDEPLIGDPLDVELFIVCSNGETVEVDDYSSSARSGQSDFFGDRDTYTQIFALGVSENEINRLIGRCINVALQELSSVEYVQQLATFLTPEAQATTFKGFVVRLDLNETGDPFEEKHFIGEKNNFHVDLGNTSGVFSQCLLREAPQDNFISVDDLRRGIAINIDVGRVADIDDEEDAAMAYGPIGYDTCAEEFQQGVEELERQGVGRRPAEEYLR